MQTNYLSFCKARFGTLFLVFLAGALTFYGYTLSNASQDSLFGFILWVLMMFFTFPWYLIWLFITQLFASILSHRIQGLILVFGMLFSFGLNVSILISVIWYELTPKPKNITHYSSGTPDGP